MEITYRVYKPRRPCESPLYRLVEQHLEELLRVWSIRFVRQHGPLRAVVERVLREFPEVRLAGAHPAAHQTTYGFFRRHASARPGLALRSASLSLPRSPAPAHRIENSFPVVAVAGVFRPRLFLAGLVLDCLSPAELRAVLDHERAHLDGRDNLKRSLVQSCPDLPLLGGPGERLRREWEEQVTADLPSTR